MRKFILLATAAVCAVSLSAKTLYLHTGGADLWGQANPAFFAHTWSTPEDNADVQLTNVAGNIFSAEINDAHNNVVFVRMPEGSTALNWDTKWNQTGDLQIPDGQNQYNITGWGDNDGNWSTYDPNADPGENPGGGGQGGGQGGEQTRTTYWYFKGEVDKSNIDNEQGGYNVFQCGLASVEVGETGYLFLVYQVTGQPGVQYMTDGWLGFDVTHATMSNCGICTNGNKLYIPAGSYTLYLYDNGDGTVELSREPLEGKTLLVISDEACGDTPGDNPGDDQAIENIYELDTNAPMFDVIGRQVNNDYHGVVIQNGHKFIR